MAGPNLTLSAIALGAFIMAISLILLLGTQFFDANSLPVNSEYNAVYTNITTTGMEGLNTINNDLQTDGYKIVTAPVQGILSTLGAFAIGMGAISTLLTLPKIVMDILAIVTEELPAVGALMWFLMFSVSIYLVMKIVKALRGTMEEA